MTGMFFVTFASINICRRYWEMVKAARPESPFSRFVGNCPVQREERRVTVSMRNPHTPGKDITTLLKRFCTVVREPTHILNGLGFWTGKWSVIVRLNKDSSAEDGLQHLPQSFSLGNSYGLIYYPDMPQICRRCSKKGHSVKDCKEDACKNCRVTGHETKDCPKRTMCNLCGQAAHSYKDCPKRDRSWED
ncbi:zinc finger CCHC domain-containing protein 3-like [Rhinoderma darwinii]|uniref:zinc finger CCHC domain-containing protein 3-like n=1 Tax=Rhinoderma darwinii TaxID=43563 RepID=UPI003F66A79D